MLSEVRLDDDVFIVICNVSYVNWFKFDGSDKVLEDWNEKYNKVFGVEIRGCVLDEYIFEYWFLCFNVGDNDVCFYLFILLLNGGWMLCLDICYVFLKE